MNQVKPLPNTHDALHMALQMLQRIANGKKFDNKEFFERCIAMIKVNAPNYSDYIALSRFNDMAREIMRPVEYLD